MLEMVLRRDRKASVVADAGSSVNLYLLVYHAFSAVLAKLLKAMAGTTGLEPAASAVTGQRSNQLNYVPFPIFTSQL